MPLIVTPGALNRLAEFYQQLAAMLTAGVTVVQALEQIQRSPPSSGLRRPVGQLLSGLRQGLTFSEAAGQVRGWLASFDLALIAAGEQSGRLDAVGRLLSGYYQSRAQLARQVLSDLAYPLFILHAAVFLFPFAQAFLGGDWVGYARQTLGVLLPFYLAVFLVVVACQGRRGEMWRAVIETLLHPVPILGRARRALALARLSAALGALLNAGVSMMKAWPLAAAASGSPALRRAVQRWLPRLQSGESPGDVLESTPAFPSMFTNLYRTGETSGTVEQTLGRLQAFYQEEATRKLRALAEWLPRLIYFAILVVVAMKIVGFWVGHYNGLFSTEP